MSKTINLGRVTAYADAVAAGYTGTREQFANDLANAANYAAEAGDAAETATEAATTARTAAETATDKAEEASADADQAHADAQAILGAKETAVAAAATASSKAGEAANSAQQAAASETAAAGSATTASNAATSATASKNAAATSETNAANSASAAAQTLTNVNQAGATQVAAIQAKGTEVLNSIPADYTTLRNDVDDLKSDLSTVQDAIEYDAPLSVDGYYINSTTGNASSSASYACTDFVAVSGASKIVYPAYFNISSVGMAFYDANQTYISGADNTGAIGDVKTTDVPANAKYFRICAVKSYVDLYGFYVYMIGVPSALNTKQDNLQAGANMDTAPTDASNKPVTSGGVYNALASKISAESVSGVIVPVTYPQLLNKDAFLVGKELQNTALVSGPEDMDDSPNWTTTNIIELTWDASGGSREFATNLQTGQFKALGYYLRNGAYVRSGSVSSVSASGDHYVFAMPEINVKMRLSIRNDIVNPDDIIITKADEWTTDPTYGVNVMSLKPGVVHDFNLETALKDKLLPSNPCAYNGNEFQAFKKVLCVGDSLTEGTFDYIESGTRKYFVDADYSYPAMLAALSGREVVNKGYGGDTFQSWYTRYQNEDLSGFDCAIIELGLNDSTQGTTSADRLTYLGNIVTKLKTENSGIKIFISTILSCYSNNNIPAVNADIISFANSTADCYLMNVYEYGSLKDDTAYAAGHLTALGYQRMAKEYYAYASKIMSENKSDFRFIQYTGTDRQYE